MKKIIPLAIAVIVLVLFISACTAVEKPGHYIEGSSAWDVDIIISDYSNIQNVLCLVSEDGLNFDPVELRYGPIETRNQNERLIGFYNRDAQYQCFQVQVTFQDGGIKTSGAIDFVEWSGYIYDTETNVLSHGEITSRKIGDFAKAVFPVVVFLSLGLTILAEWLISLVFRLKPSWFVVVISAVTFIAMNILLVVIFNHSMLSYYLILIMLELLFAAIELLFYMLKYKTYTKKRLLLFTLTANVVSGVIYYLISSNFFLNT